MLIQCTRALLEKIGLKENELASPKGTTQFPDSFMAWHANFITINRRRAIILMNNETRYPVVIYRPTPNDFLKLKELIQEAIREALRMEGVHKAIIEDYIGKAGEISFFKTANRSMVAKMNSAVRYVEFLEGYLDEQTRIQRYVSGFGARYPQYLDGKDGFFLPLERMLKLLDETYAQNENRAKEDVLDVDLYQLKVKIDIEGYDIWRRVLVPATYSFRYLHNIIQTVFDWQNYHLHDFTVEREDEKQLLIVMDDDPETLEYLNEKVFEIRQERFVALEEVFPKYGKVIYEYDFGDAWEHCITLEKIVKSNVFQAKYIGGNGERPPEDVGGNRGYIEYMEIMADKQHPEYEGMNIWAESQRQRKLSEEKINHRLKQVVRTTSHLWR